MSPKSLVVLIISVFGSDMFCMTDGGNTLPRSKTLRAERAEFCDSWCLRLASNLQISLDDFRWNSGAFAFTWTPTGCGAQLLFYFETLIRSALFCLRSRSATCHWGPLCRHGFWLQTKWPWLQAEFEFERRRVGALSWVFLLWDEKLRRCQNTGRIRWDLYRLKLHILLFR